jgi:hypothetical protein
MAEAEERVPRPWLLTSASGWGSSFLDLYRFAGRSRNQWYIKMYFRLKLCGTARLCSLRKRDGRYLSEPLGAHCIVAGRDEVLRRLRRDREVPVVEPNAGGAVDDCRLHLEHPGTGSHVVAGPGDTAGLPGVTTRAVEGEVGTRHRVELLHDAAGRDTDDPHRAPREGRTTAAGRLGAERGLVHADSARWHRHRDDRTRHVDEDTTGRRAGPGVVFGTHLEPGLDAGRMSRQDCLGDTAAHDKKDTHRCDNGDYSLPTTEHDCQSPLTRVGHGYSWGITLLSW